MGVSLAWYLSYTLGKKLDGLYSKSKPHRLDKQKHLYVNKAHVVSPNAGPVINADAEEEEEEEEEQEPDQAKDFHDQMTRIKENVINLFRRTKDDLERKFDRANRLTSSTESVAFLQRDNPDILMKMVASKSPIVWKFGIESLATMVSFSLLIEEHDFKWIDYTRYN